MTVSTQTINDWGLSSLTEAQGIEAVDTIGRLIYQAVLVRSLSILSEKEEKELDDLLDKDETTPKEVLAYLQSKIRNFGEIVKEERDNLKKEFAS